MNDLYRHRDTCRLCGSADVAVVLRLAPVPLITPNIGTPAKTGPGVDFAREIPLDLYHCGACGHIQLLDVVAPEIIYGNYLYRTNISVGLPEHFRELARDLSDRFRPEPGALVVEIGSNDGTQLAAFKERGLRVLGVDPAGEIAADATRRGLETLHAFFTPELAARIRTSYGYAAIVVANNVIANIDDMNAVAEGLAAVLAPDGVFVMETSYALDVFRDCLIDTIYHEHISYFLVGPLGAFFRRHGLELIHVERVATKGGSIRLAVQRRGGRYEIDPSVTRALDAEKDAGMDCRPILKSLERRIESIRRELTELLSADLAAGGKVAGYGASVGTQSIIHQLGLGRHLSCVIDDRPLKDVLAGPDFHLPIVGADKLGTEPPASVVILAWRYADGIMARNQGYLRAGGRFIIPLPQLSIVSDPS